jgi:hypothetical protein
VNDDRLLEARRNAEIALAAGGMLADAGFYELAGWLRRSGRDVIDLVGEVESERSARRAAMERAERFEKLFLQQGSKDRAA